MLHYSPMWALGRLVHTGSRGLVPQEAGQGAQSHITGHPRSLSGATQPTRLHTGLMHRTHPLCFTIRDALKGLWYHLNYQIQLSRLNSSVLARCLSFSHGSNILLASLLQADFRQRRGGSGFLSTVAAFTELGISQVGAMTSKPPPSILTGVPCNEMCSQGRVDVGGVRCGHQLALGHLCVCFSKF